MTDEEFIQQWLDFAYHPEDWEAGHLSLFHRQELTLMLWSAFGERGLRTALALELRCAALLLPRWLEHHPDSSPMLELLSVLSRVVRNGPPDNDRIREVVSNASTLFDSQLTPETSGSGWALLRAASGTDLRGPNLPDGTTDDDLDAWAWQAAYLASLELAGGPWDESSSPERRRVFWQFYCLDLVPAALADTADMRAE